MKTYNKLAIDNAADLIFGTAPHPLKTKMGMELGGGTVYPELNFTLPPMLLNDDTFGQVRAHYEEIISGALKRAVELDVPGVQFEFETLPPMTLCPEWGTAICEILLTAMAEANEKHGLKSVLRMTPNDNREMVRPPEMRSGKYWEQMLETFDRSAALGAELLSIESVGGKEIHDEALTMCDLRQVIFSLCIMGVRDMRFLWTHIAEIAGRHGVHAAGDTACGFGNTAMVLAEKQMIPRVFAAVDRAVTAVRSLVAYECGAVGPGKDCGYENVILKAITGYPMAMEGKTAACAHLSQVGNVAAAACDVWSNESVENMRMLGGMAPTCYMEQLAYDCRLMNTAAAEGRDGALTLQRWLVNSDALMDPQAYVLSPASAIEIGRSIVEAPNHYAAGRAAASTAIALIRKGKAEGLRIPERELGYLDMMESTLEGLPDDEDVFVAEMMTEVSTGNFRPEDYEIG